MNGQSPQVGDTLVLGRQDLQSLITELGREGYRVIGPVLGGGAIVHQELTSVDQLPAGWGSEQAPGSYRLKARGDRALFGYVSGPHIWRTYLHPPVVRVWRAVRENGGLRLIADDGDAPRFAFFGVRPCDLHAIAIQDQVLTKGPYADPCYAARREQAFIVAVNCGRAGGTCFCVSMKTGPKATSGFDLALTEIIDERRHDFLVEVGTKAGARVLGGVSCRPAAEADTEAAARVVAEAAAEMGRVLDTSGLKERLARSYEHPRWAATASRCLTCANCTMVCPTCFCTTVEDATDLTGSQAERWRKWDSCFSVEFSYLHGGSVRPSARARYRQWMTHKLSTWVDQFGTSGCVGCGRCITWCPVGIDITEEAAVIAGGEQAGQGRIGAKENDDGDA
jgi:ferredoxin